MNKNIFYAILLLFITNYSNAQKIVHGEVKGENNNILIGASVRELNSSIIVVTDSNGLFKINLPKGHIVLQISYQGYQTYSISLDEEKSYNLTLNLTLDNKTLNEILITTGYQVLNKEKVTGSVFNLDNSSLDRRVSTDILSKIENQVPGLIFNKGKSAKGTQDISIRGQSTLFSNTKPLIVLDNFPFEGNIEDINPNDIESITILKDAAAASIWGARAGNGVIVINSKRGNRSKKTNISFNSNLTIGQKPNLFYHNTISSSDYSDLELQLFDKNYFRSVENSVNRTALSPVVELLILKRNNPNKADSIDKEIEQLKKNDIRNDYLKYLYRENVNQQYAFNIDGGSENQNFYLSLGLDENKETLIKNSFDRLTINAANRYILFKNKLEINTSISYSNKKNLINNSGTSSITSAGSSIYPYAKLVDDKGNYLQIDKDYSKSFLEEIKNKGLLDWSYVPLDEINFSDNSRNSVYYKVNANIRYNLNQNFKFSLLYQYDYRNQLSRNHQSIQTYYTRNQINRLTKINENNSIERPIPLGGILDLDYNNQISNSGRAQLEYNKNWKKSDLTLLIGADVQLIDTKVSTFRYYGYDDNNATSKPVDYLRNYELFVNPGSKSNLIPNIDKLEVLADRNRSFFSHLNYDYLNRYYFSASARIDQSNLFGVNTNQKGVPLWSVGFAWKLTNEPFFDIKWLSDLKLRFSYGFNGNVSKSVSAYTTAQIGLNVSPLTQLRYASIINPPNPELRWEKVKIINTGLDFAIGSRISGSFDYFSKIGQDLLGTIPFPASSGIRNFRGNTASTRSNGIDLIINSRNIVGKFNWNTSLIFSNLNEIVTEYGINATVNSYMQFGDGGAAPYPLKGRPLYSIYSYKWAGLDPENGDPMGYLNGEISKDWSTIISTTNYDNLNYNGPVRPTVFGSFNNSFSIKAFSISTNISYKFGHYFRLSSVFYSNNMGFVNRHGDYSLRWKNEGDEKYTQVPSIPLVANANRDNFYNYSSVLVKKGDHIRWQDLQLAYNISAVKIKYLKSIQVYFYMNNLGILWKAADTNLDPDYALYSIPPSKTFAFGIKLNL